MTPRALGAIVLIFIGGLLTIPVVVILGLAALLLELVHGLWADRGLDGVTYVRRLATNRTSWGDEIPMTIEVWNRKRLPLAWLRADDLASDGVKVRGRDLVQTAESGDVLRNIWTLAPYERVTRHVRLAADRRGVFEIGPVELSVGDLFARPAAHDERPVVDRFIVRPRTVPAPGLTRPDRWGDLHRSRAGLAEDPSRFAGIRPYSPGDPLRRIHAMTSARLGRPMTKKFEPSQERQVLIALDIETQNGPGWDISYTPELVETLCVTAGSLARSLAAERAAFGITVAGYTRTRMRFADVAIAEGPAQVDRVLDLLARLSSFPSASFERLLARIRRTTQAGTTVIVVTARDPRAYLTELRHLRRAGLGVVILACGGDAVAAAAVGRAAGFPARVAWLDGPWQTASRLVVSG
jgi:uncharacterized protein (DUF58 family)